MEMIGARTPATKAPGPNAEWRNAHAGGDDKIVDFERWKGMPSLEVQTRRTRSGLRVKRPPVTMPRWASRSIIEITAVHVERVQDVTEEEAKRCGHECMLNTDGTSGWHADRAPFGSDYSWLKAAKHCWIADHGQASWDRNDWVWVRDVRRVER